MSESAPSHVVMFADIVNSPRLNRDLGDRRASEVVTQSLAALALEVEDCGGRIVDRVGDELMCVFSEAAQTILTACKLGGVALRPTEDRPRGIPIHLRIRLDCGELIERDGQANSGCPKLDARRGRVECQLPIGR
ncbi:MAG: class 3 adenylate cyclase [Planctomycetota bacterium]|jgi:class 3 adenylate cyclase